MAKTNSKTRAQAGAASRPEAAPPEGDTLTESEATVGLDKPRELTEAELSGVLATDVMGGAPTLEPPELEAAAAEGITVWQADKRVSALWSNGSIRNSWAHIVGVGWKKLHNQSDTAITSMTMMLSHARQMQSRVDYRDEADGMIHEVYVW